MRPTLKYLLFACLLTFIACEGLVEIDKPVTMLTRDAVFEDDLTAVAAVSGLYGSFSTGLGSGGFTSLTYLTSLSSDDLMVQQGDSPLQFFQNDIQSTNPDVSEIWTELFNVIYQANSIVEGLEDSHQLTPALKDQLSGEAIFIRAFAHFYLASLFGDVPYIITTDYRANGLVSRLPVSEVFEKITSDLLQAKSLLSEDYFYSKKERVRANKWVAASLLARVYLWREDWVRAEEQAATVISESSLYTLNDDISKVFLKNSGEAIWQLIPPGLQQYTTEGSIFNRFYSAAIATISDDLFNAFDPADQRRNVWVGIGSSGGYSWRYPMKYRENVNTGTGAEYYMVFRLAEQYLIRAEARAKQSKVTGPGSAESDLNVIRNRAGLPNTIAVTQEDMLTAIELERRVELFTEWGHRWLDLKRTGRATAVLGLIKPTWNATDTLYPIPYSELQLNPNMTQNQGY